MQKSINTMSTQTQRDFTFDAKIFASFTVKAGSEVEARNKLTELLDGGTIMVGEATGIQLFAVAGLDGELDLMDE